MDRKLPHHRDLRHLVVNADDFGLTPGVSRGVGRAFDEGLVTSTSLLANGLGFEEAIRIAVARPRLSVGLHLNLTDGAPVSKVSEVESLVDGEGKLLGYRTFSLRLLAGRIVRSELRREVAAQLDRLIAAGLSPSHVDGHRHIHLLPVLFDVVAAVAEARGITYLRCPAGPTGKVAGMARAGAAGIAGIAGIAAARQLGFIGFGRLHHARLAERGLATCDLFLGAAMRRTDLSLRDEAALLEQAPLGLTEWMVHPGEVDAELVFVDDYLWRREQELAFLCSAEATAAVEAAGLTLVNFRGELKLRAVAEATAQVA